MYLEVNENSDPIKLNFTWEILEYEPYYAKFDLDFKYPDYISSTD